MYKWMLVLNQQFKYPKSTSWKESPKCNASTLTLHVNYKSNLWMKTNVNQRNPLSILWGEYQSVLSASLFNGT